MDCLVKANSFSSIEAILIDAFVDRNCIEELKEKYHSSFSASEIVSRKNNMMSQPHFSCNSQESEMLRLAKKLTSLKRFADV